MKFHHRWAVTAFFIVALSVSSMANAAPVSGQSTWETTLQARDFNGNTATIEGYYDTTLNITWLASNFNFNDAGLMTLDLAYIWAGGLNINGITGWRLPAVGPVNGTSFDYLPAYNGSTDVGFNVSEQGTAYAGSTASEMAHLFYNTLGNMSPCATTSIYPTCSEQPYGLGNTGPFSDFQLRPSSYWSYDDYDAWYFNFYNGDQGYLYSNPTNKLYAWAVHSGDVGAAVATVPVPAAVWLFGSGLMGLIGIARRRSSQSAVAM